MKKTTTVLAGAMIAGALAMQDAPATNDEIRPFHVHIQESQLSDLRRRVEATQWPDRETVADESQGLGYALEMANRPQTLYGINDSPIGLAAWMIDHDARSQELIGRVFDGQTAGLTRDDILDNITLYWVTNTAISSARLYWENKLAFFDVKHITIPVAVSAFPDEIYQVPRSWAEKAFPHLIHYNKLDRGGHFAAWEQPQLFTEELRGSFRTLR
ncbi:MAG TPA: epoxide hydrolase N-terminal domain-containing protein [Puia sp.]|jgi:pimeloyl-ACP methyl ester carboxylesterase|nr:epoxide hydrolase N-terminal domain-containing protein [Puia sp.]